MHNIIELPAWEKLFKKIVWKETLETWKERSLYKIIHSLIFCASPYTIKDNVLF